MTPCVFTLGSMCSGYGGLDMAVAQVLDVRTAWVADPDPGAAAILAHHWPNVPNLGDITVTDFSQVEQVDVLCAGFPCQDISYAGRGEGIQEGNRSGLWHTIANAIAVLRPRLVVLENVAAIVGRRPGLDVVLADLARLGFDAEWLCVRASDVGAPHRRERWFLAAHPQGQGLPGPWLRRPASERDRAAANAEGERYGNAWSAGVRGVRAAPVGGPATHAQGDGRNARRPEPARQQRRPDAALSGGAPADADGCGLPGNPERHSEPIADGEVQAQRGPDADGRVLDWGQYAPAIERWARIVGRPAPHPHALTATGGQGLNPALVEWMMGLPAGWITGVPGLTRNRQLKAGGNGVVWQQAVYALPVLLDRLAVAA